MAKYLKSCDGCPYRNRNHLENKYKKMRNLPTDSEINNSDTLIVLQSPGEVEWENGLPLQNFESGRSAASRIKKSWKREQKNRKNFDITNSVLCYQGKNKSGTADRSISKKALKRCKTRLKNLITKRKYKKVIVFGTPAKSIINEIKKEVNIPFEVKQSKHPCARKGKPKDTDLDLLWKL